jgi:hypothetical protein
MGVIEGWWKGWSHNRPTNKIFKLVNQLSDESNCFFYTKYVPTKLNPADGPSRGIYGPTALLLPPPPIPPQFQHLIVDFNHPPLPIELSMARQGTLLPLKPKPPRDTTCSDTTYTPNHHALDLLARTADQ